MFVPALRRGVLAAVLGSVALAGAAPAGWAQGGFQTLDPFQVGETARRAFEGGFAVSGEAGFRDTDLLGLSEPGAPGSPFALAGRLDYALLPQVDLSLVADLSGGVGRGPLGLSWVVVKPYWHNDLTDYAVRVAVDPASEGGLGFRQTDVAFLSSTLLSPDVTTDVSLGLRRVRAGYTTAAALDGDGLALEDAVAFDAFDDGQRVRIVGQELRVGWGYNVVFDPAGSRLSAGLVAEAGDYAVLRTARPPEQLPETGSGRIRSGTGWLRVGAEFSRPAYQLAPFVSLPVLTWADVLGEPIRHGPRPAKLRAGLRLTLR